MSNQINPHLARYSIPKGINRAAVSNRLETMIAEGMTLDIAALMAIDAETQQRARDDSNGIAYDSGETDSESNVNELNPDNAPTV